MNGRQILEDCDDADCVGRGEGEELLPDYLDNLETPGRVAGLVWRSGSQVVENPPRPILKDLDRFPYPDRKACRSTTSSRCRSTCPRCCRWTASARCRLHAAVPILRVLRHPVAGRWQVALPLAEHVLGEMQQLHDQGYRSIYLTDDHFLLKRKRINEICQGIIDRKLEFNWGCEGRVDSVAMDQFPIMAQGQLQLPGFRRRGGHPEGARPPQEEADAGADRARGAARPSSTALTGPTDSSWSARRTRPKRTSWRASALRPGSSSTRSASTGCAPTAARRCGRSTSSAGSSTTSATGTSGSSARTSTRPSCRASW